MPNGDTSSYLVPPIAASLPPGSYSQSGDQSVRPVSEPCVIAAGLPREVITSIIQQPFTVEVKFTEIGLVVLFVPLLASITDAVVNVPNKETAYTDNVPAVPV